MINKAYASMTPDIGLPPIPLQSPAQVIDRNKQAADGGLFSAFTSYVSSFANDEPPEPSDQEIEYTLCTVDCVNACSFQTLFQNIRYGWPPRREAHQLIDSSALPLDSLKVLVMTLLARLPEDTSPKIMIVKPEIPAPTPIRPNGQKAKQVGLAYDPSLLFILDFATRLSSRDEQTIDALGKDLAMALMGVVRDASGVHPVTLSRAVYYLLSFVRASHVSRSQDQHS